MHPDTEFDPDDNFAHGAESPHDIDDEASVEELVWQLLLLVNPGDEDLALQQFTGYRDAQADAEPDEIEPILLVRDVIDWKSGFHVGDADAAALVDSLTELTARWNLQIDWGVEDPTDDEFLAAASISELIGIAYDHLRPYGYTLWTCETDADSYAGWITLTRDDDAMRVVAPALGIEVRPGAG